MNSAPFQHLVVLMLENRSFDHMLGRLYNPNNPPPYNFPPNNQTFDGVPAGASNSGPNPSTPDGAPWLTYYADRIHGDYYNSPGDNDVVHAFDDVQTQMLLEMLDPATMAGFVWDRSKQLRNPTIAQLQAVMSGFSPVEENGSYSASRVLSTLANNFAVCDNWFCSMPGPTFPNRSFLHAATSNGFIFNGADWNAYSAPTIFNRVNGEFTAKIYLSGRGTTGQPDYPGVVYELHPNTINTTDFPPCHLEQFFSDASDGSLASYSFIEPCIIGYDKVTLPDDQHPQRDIRFGENLLARVYNALRSGPNWDQTFLIVIYDEHGGFYDHSFPPPATPPDGNQSNFKFNQFGPRVPAVFISPYIPAGTVFHPSSPPDHTSVIKTLSTQWVLEPLNNRDVEAPDLSPVLSGPFRSDTPTSIDLWKLPLTAMDGNLPLNDLQRDYVALVAANRGLECPAAMSTEEDARTFLAKIL
jgi:phospholipase C